MSLTKLSQMDRMLLDLLEGRFSSQQTEITALKQSLVEQNQLILSQTAQLETQQVALTDLQGRLEATEQSMQRLSSMLQRLNATLTGSLALASSGRSFGP